MKKRQPHHQRPMPPRSWISPACTTIPDYFAAAPAADRQNGSFKALSGKGSAPATPPPFRHTPFRPRPRHTATVWRNPGRHPHRDGTFTFSAKEKDSETGLSYFGSRYYSADLSIWLSVDPMSDKYASLSPYVYCADNPVKLVDPNGEDIWIIGEDGNQYRFYQGYLYTEEGKLYIPDLDSFLSDAQDAINALRGTETGNRLISTFEGPNNKDVFIESGSKSNCDYLTTDANGEFVSQIIFWNSEGTDLMTTEGMQKSSTTDLGHEFSHVYDNVKKIKGLKDLCPNKGSRSEWRAVYKENCIREELGLPYRTGYTFKNPNGTTYFVPMLNQKGKPYMPDSFQWTPFEVCKRKAN